MGLWYEWILGIIYQKKTNEVVNKDTLYNIFKKCNNKVYKLEKYNNLKSNSIKIAQLMIVK